MTGTWGLATAQAGLAGILMALAMLAPPARGDMLVIPMTSTGAQGLAAQLIGAGATLTGRGRPAGSFVIRADRDRMLWRLMAQGVVVLAAPDLLCRGQGRQA